MRYVFLLACCLMLLATGCQTDSSEATKNPSPQQTMTGGMDAPIPEPSDTTERRFDQVMDAARQKSLYERPIGEIMQTIGKQFMGTPYVIGPLDRTEQEALVCRLDGFDCFTFVESMLAMARGIKQQDYTWDTYARNVRNLRYRDGEMDGYCSRLHYFSEWIADNEERGHVRNITEEIGGERLPKTLNYMTQHRGSYPRFANNDSLYQCIQEREKNLRDLTLYHVPQDSIRAVYDELQTGDIIATSTDFDGLDVTHTGLVHKDNDGNVGLLHASTSGGVKVSPDLQDYVQNIEKQIGIVVTRPQNPSGAAAQRIDAPAARSEFRFTEVTNAHERY